MKDQKPRENQKPVLKKEVITIDKHTQVFNVDTASYTTEDAEGEVDWELARQDQDGLPNSESANSDEGSTSNSSSEGETALVQI